MKKRLLSGMRASGALHIGHLFGAIRNYVTLQEQYESFFFIATWHGLTTEYKQPPDFHQLAIETVADWIACGVDPNKATIFMQDSLLEHAELHLLFSMVTPLGWLERVPTYKEQQEELKEKELNTYGFLGYPVLQAADIALYKAAAVPVGQDQLPHLELSREIVRRFNHIYGNVLVEPAHVLSEFPKVPGLDGRKMSKSYGNAISLGESAESVDKRVRKMVTDPARVKRSDPGNPEVCPVYDLHKMYQDGPTLESVAADCRTAAVGCIDCKKRLLDKMLPQLGTIRDKRTALLADKDQLVQILGDGTARARGVAKDTMREVRSVMGLGGKPLVGG